MFSGKDDPKVPLTPGNFAIGRNLNRKRNPFRVIEWSLQQFHYRSRGEIPDPPATLSWEHMGLESECPLRFRTHVELLTAGKLNYAVPAGVDFYKKSDGLSPRRVIAAKSVSCGFHAVALSKFAANQALEKLDRGTHIRSTVEELKQQEVAKPEKDRNDILDPKFTYNNINKATAPHVLARVKSSPKAGPDDSDDGLEPPKKRQKATKQSAHHQARTITNEIVIAVPQSSESVLQIIV